MRCRTPQRGRSGSLTTHRACIHEESTIPAQILHGKLKDRRLRHSSVTDAECSLGRQVKDSTFQIQVTQSQCNDNPKPNECHPRKSRSSLFRQISYILKRQRNIYHLTEQSHCESQGSQINFSSKYMIFFPFLKIFCTCDRVSMCSSGWIGEHCIAQSALELIMILLPPPSQSWD